MNVYRLLPNECEYLITDESDFLSQTNSRFPWVQEKPDSETHIPKKHYYAICPACGCPVELINLIESKRKQNSPSAYAKHVRSDVSGLAKYDQNRYDLCPLASGTYSVANKPRRQGDVSVNKIYIDFLKENLDKIIYMYEKSLGILFSDRSIERMLSEFLAFENEKILAINKFNFPWLFLLSINFNFSEFKIKKDGRLFKQIEKLKSKGIKLFPTKSDNLFVVRSENGKYLDLAYVTVDYELYDGSKHERRERAKISVSQINESASALTVPEKILTFYLNAEPDYFNKILNLKNWERSPRQKKIMSIASSVL